MVLRWFHLDAASPRRDARLVAAEALVNYPHGADGQATLAVSGITPLPAPPPPVPIPPADVDINGGISLSDIGQITGRWNGTGFVAPWP